AFPVIDAIQHEEVKVDVQIERAAESLDQRHGSGHTARTCQAGLADQMPRDRAIDDAERLRDDLGPGREQIAQRKRQRQHPLADRLARQDVVAMAAADWRAWGTLAYTTLLSTLVAHTG